MGVSRKMRREALLYIIDSINNTGNPGKKAVQKIVYLLQRRGVELQYHYQIHFFGPYSSALDYELQSFERQGSIIIEQKGSSSLVKSSPCIWENISRESLQEELEPYLQTIQDVLEEYGKRPARELELLTTVDFVAQELAKGGEAPGWRDLFRVVHILKGSKFNNEDIDKAIAELGESDLGRYLT